MNTVSIPFTIPFQLFSGGICNFERISSSIIKKPHRSCPAQMLQLQIMIVYPGYLGEMLILFFVVFLKAKEFNCYIKNYKKAIHNLLFITIASGCESRRNGKFGFSQPLASLKLPCLPQHLLIRGVAALPCNFIKIYLNQLQV